MKDVQTAPDLFGSQPAGRTTLSRRRLLGRSAGAAGIAVGVWLWVPLLSQAQTTAPPPKKLPVGTAALADGAPTATPTARPPVQQAPAGQGVRFFLEFPQPVQGATDPLAGESLDPEHPNTVELLSAALGIRNPNPLGSVAAGTETGRATFEALRVVKNVDVTSPSLLTVIGQGATFPQINLYLRRGSATDDLATYRFVLARVTAIAIESADDSPRETLDFVFGAMDITYPGTATPGSPGTAAWSVVTNQPVLDVGQ